MVDLRNQVTIVIPCYRQEHYLQECVESALGQSYPVERIIVVDDGSDTRDKDIYHKAICALDPARITLFSQENLGLSAARNAGIQRAETEYILPLDADDRLKPKFIESCIPYLLEYPEIGFVYPWVECFGAQEYIWQCPAFDPGELRWKNLLNPSALYRRSMWEAIGGYDESWRQGYEDWDFWMSAVEKGWAGVCLPKVLFEYRLRKDSMLAECSQEENFQTVFKNLVKKHPNFYSSNQKLSPNRQNKTQVLESLDDVSPMKRVVRKINLAAQYLSVRPKGGGGKDLKGRYIFFELRGLFRGGMEKVVLSLADGMQKQGCKIVFLCTQQQGNNAEKAIQLGAEVVLLQGDQHLEYLRLLRKYRPVLHIDFGSFLATPWAHRAKVPVYWNLQNIYAWYHPEDWHHISSMAGWVRRVIGVSQDTIDYFSRYVPLAPHQAVLIPNGIEPVPCRLRERGGVPRLLLVGRVEPIKGHLSLIEAIHLLDLQGLQCSLTLIGDMSESQWYAYNILRLIEKYNLNDRVRLLDHTDSIADYYSTHDILIQPSLVEGFSLVATEAASAGMPAILCDVGGARDLAASGAAVRLLEPPYENLENLDWSRLQIEKQITKDCFVKRLALAIRELWEQYDDYAKKAKSCSDTISRLFSSNAMIKRYLDLFSETL